MILATETNNMKEVRKTQVIGGEFSCDSMSQSMGLDNHTAASVISGLVDHNQGASNILNDLPDPGETTVTLGWTLQSKQKLLDLKTLVDQGIPPLPTGVAAESNVTHVVVGILYGAEAFVSWHKITMEEQTTPRKYSNASRRWPRNLLAMV